MIALFQVRNIVLDAENPLLIAMHQVPRPTCLTCVFLLTVKGEFLDNVDREKDTIKSYIMTP